MIPHLTGDTSTLATKIKVSINNLAVELEMVTVFLISNDVQV